MYHRTWRLSVFPVVTSLLLSPFAVAALDAASDAMDSYAKIAREERSAEIEKFPGEIEKLSTKIADRKQGDSATEKIEERILSWWDRVVEWREE